LGQFFTPRGSQGWEGTRKKKRNKPHLARKKKGTLHPFRLNEKRKWRKVSALQREGGGVNLSRSIKRKRKGLHNFKEKMANWQFKKVALFMGKEWDKGQQSGGWEITGEGKGGLAFHARRSLPRNIIASTRSRRDRGWGGWRKKVGEIIREKKESTSEKQLSKQSRILVQGKGDYSGKDKEKEGRATDVRGLVLLGGPSHAFKRNGKESF